MSELTNYIDARIEKLLIEKDSIDMEDIYFSDKHSTIEGGIRELELVLSKIEELGN